MGKSWFQLYWNSEGWSGSKDNLIVPGVVGDDVAILHLEVTISGDGNKTRSIERQQ